MSLREHHLFLLAGKHDGGSERTELGSFEKRRLRPGIFWNGRELIRNGTRTVPFNFCTCEKSEPVPEPSIENEQVHQEWDARSRARQEWDTRSRPREHSRAGSERRTPVSSDARASHSRHINTASVPDSPPFEVFVTNINYKSTEEELYYFFGGDDGGVLDVVANEAQGPLGKRGTATVSFSNREALIAALQHDRAELLGRPLRIALKHQRPPRNDYYGTFPGANEYGQYRSNSYAGMGSAGSAYTSSLPPRPRGPPPPSNYQCYNYDTYGSRTERHPAYYDNRRNDFGNRSLRYANNSAPNVPNIAYQQQRYNRPYNGRHSLYENSSTQYRGSTYDISGRGRVRTDSMTSVPQTGTFHEEHHERRRLELQPRTKPIGDADENQPVRKSSIFGEAKPVDTSEKERQAEERLRLEDEAFRRSNSSTRKLSSDYGHARPSSSYGKVTLMKSASHDGVHGMIVKQNSVVEEPLLEENSVPEVPPHKHLPPSSPHLPPRPPPHVSSSSSVPIAPSLEPPVPQRQAFSGSDSTAMMHLPAPPVASGVTTDRGPSPARSFRSHSKDNVVDSSSNDARPSSAQQRAKHGYNRTFTRSSFRNHTPAKQATPQQGVETGHASGAAAGSGGGTAGSATVGRGGGRRGGRRRGGSAASREKKRQASREQARATPTDGSQNVEENTKKEEPVKKVEPTKQEVVTRGEEPTKKEEKPKSDEKKESRPSKKEKKKQVAKEMPKVEPKSVNFSSRNKFAALLETDE
uniref:RRM domain-containing protein n=1 Tax=Ascaris lumbricoides TaxID=6252 RepID=A0A0M3I940_ASCLU